MKKKTKSKTRARSAKNLARFFHYHDGEGHERAIKIGASFLACLALLIIAFLSMLIPELAPAALAQENETAILPTPPLPTAETAPTVETSPTPVPAPSPENQSAPSPTPVPQENGEPGPNEEWERQNALQDRNNVLREMRDQKRELRKVCAQFKRLKNASADLAACNQLLAQVAEWEGKIKPWNGAEAQELRELMDDYRELQVWEQLSTLQLKANLPRELNDFFRSLNQVERLLKQKSFQKIPGLNFEVIRGKLAEIKALHAAAKSCYDAGDLECASEKLNEAREGSYPGELEGSLHNLRNINEMLRQVKNQEVKDEIKALLQSAIDSINAGDWREGREDIESYNNEVTQFLQYLIRAQQKSRKAPGDTLQRLEKLLNKYGGENGGDGNDHAGGQDRR